MERQPFDRSSGAWAVVGTANGTYCSPSDSEDLLVNHVLEVVAEWPELAEILHNPLDRDSVEALVSIL
jgi:hypothetical protein